MIAYLLLITIQAQYLPLTSGGCNSGDYLYSSGDISYCLTCQKGCTSCCDPLLCNTCDSKYRYNETLSTCIRCPVNCQVCIANGLFSQCTQCESGYIINTDGSCSSCGDDCISCSTAGYCTTCADQFYVEKGTCVDCTYGCKSCYLADDDTIICDSCIDKYYLVGEQCLQCDTGCVTCTDFYTCTQCSSAYMLTDSATCEYCTSSCTECDGTTCKTCASGYVLTTDNTCLGCPDINCLNCLQDDRTKCTSCSSGYYLLTNTCIKCSTTCNICDTANHCTECSTGYYLKSGTCIANTISNCSYQTESACTTCSTGYYLKNGACSACTSNCDSCTGDYQCNSCATAYFFNGFGCSGCGTGCETCVDSNICLKCTYGFYINKGVCERCTDGICQCSLKEAMTWNFTNFLSNPSSEFADSANFIQYKRPNQFCLKIFNQQSYDDLKIEECQLQQLQDNNMFSQQFSLNQFFQNPQLSLELKSKLPSLDKYIKKKRNHKKAKKQSAAIRDYKKNICRNILRHGIKNIGNQSSQEFLLKQFHQSNIFLDDFQKFYQQNLEIISGFRVLKDHLIIDENEQESEKQRKQVFQQYLIWFLKTQATKYILQSEANNIQEYIKYKNDVLLYYVQQPQQWYSNKPLWKK